MTEATDKRPSRNHEGTLSYFLEKASIVLIYSKPEDRFRRPAGATAIREIADIADDL